MGVRTDLTFTACWWQSWVRCVPYGCTALLVIAYKEIKGGYVSYWNITKQIIQISFIGFSLFAVSFIVSLFIGTAATHPILEPPSSLIAYAQFIMLASVALSLTNQLVALSPRKKHIHVPPTRQAYYHHLHLSKSGLAKY